MKVLPLIALLATTSLFAQSNSNDSLANIEKLIKTGSASKCADGSEKVYQDMGTISTSVNRPYVAKSNEQVFVVIEPAAAGSHVRLYYCPIRNISWVNGKQQSTNVPLARYAFNLGNLKKNDYCDFSDIQGGTVDLSFQGMQTFRVQLRPIVSTSAESSEYKKLCSDKKKWSSIVQDSDCSTPVPAKVDELSNQVSEAVKKKYSCDMTDLISGQMLVGGGLSVKVDDINKKAEIYSVVVYPGAQDKLGSVLSLQQGTNRYSMESSTSKESFELLDQDTGILTQTYNGNNQSKTQAFRCKFSK